MMNLLSILRQGSLLSLGLLVVACGGAKVSENIDSPASAEGVIKIDGSSTVYPITDEVAKEFEFEQPNSDKLEVNFSGTGGGFKKFCNGETEINNASRPITTEEMEVCKSAGIEYVEIPVAFDALSIVVHPDNTWASDISVEELKKLWEPAAEGKIVKWNQIRESWPDRPIKLYGAGEDSGTFDYFTSVIVGESGASRKDYTASEDDTLLVRGVRSEPDSLGYFGYSYYKDSNETVKALSVDGGNGAVFPSGETVKDGTYQPLSRPLFIYVNRAKADADDGLESLVNFYLANARVLVNVTGYQPLPDDAYSLALDRFEQRKVGSVFAGKSQANVTIEDLLKLEGQ